MKSRFVLPALCLTLIAALVLLRPAGPPRLDERARITRHLADVEALLRDADVRGLREEERVARGRALDALRAYWVRGVYPHNHVRGDARTPVFIDEHGTHCAVGYMIAMSGNESLARRIAATANEATIAELADDPELRQWLAATGLSALDAALIQPTYGPIPREDQDYDRATVVASLIDLPLAAVNLFVGPVHRNPWGAIGMVAGLGQVGLGVHGLIRHEDRTNGPDYIRFTSIAVNLGIGAFGTGVGLHRLLSGEGADAGNDGADGADGDAGLALSPWLAPDGRPGFALSLRF